MSYTTCFLCGNMTSMYDKYCTGCLAKYSPVQGSKFVPKTKFGTADREREKQREISKDFLGLQKSMLRPVKRERTHKFGRKISRR